MLLSGALGHPMDQMARHAWFAARRPGEDDWHIFEVPGIGEDSDPFDREYLHVVLVKTWRGSSAEAGIECLEQNAPPWLDALHYRFYPGPNCNTFAEAMLRKCGLHASLPSPDVGKDWRGGFGAGVTSEGTGVQIETPVIGLKVGLKEGIEVHIIGLSIGVDLWPPAIILPLGSGRLGFADR